MNTGVRLRSPDVPGFWSAKGVVLIVLLGIVPHPQKPLIELRILFGTGVPADFGLHAASLHLAPDLGPRVEADSPRDRIAQRPLLGRRKDNSRRDAGVD